MQKSSSNAEKRTSALCVYPLKLIKERFLENIRRCFAGTGSRGLDFISPSLRCFEVKSLQFRLTDTFCGVDINTPLGGELPLIGSPAMTFDAGLTGVAVTTVGDYTVALLGTGAGHLKKAVLYSGSNGTEFEDIKVYLGHPVNRDLTLDPDGEHVYVITGHKVTKLRVNECSQRFENCFHCISESITSDIPFCTLCMSDTNCAKSEIRIV